MEPSEVKFVLVNDPLFPSLSHSCFSPISVVFIMPFLDSTILIHVVPYLITFLSLVYTIED